MADGEYAQTRERALAGSRAMLVRHVTVLALSLGGTTFLVRELGPALWGAFSICYGLLIATDMIITRGVMAALLRRVVPATPAFLASSARAAGLAGALVGGVILLLAVGLRFVYSPRGFTELLLATGTAAFVLSLRALPLTMLERELRYRVVAVAEILDMVVFYAVAIPFAAVGRGLAGLVLATLARGFVSLVVIRRAARMPWWGTSAHAAARKLLAFGLPLCAVTIVGALETLVPAIVIGADVASVGFLVFAVSVLGYTTAVATVVQRVAVPSFARLGGAELTQAIRRSIDLSCFLTLSVLIPAGALASVWVETAFGPKWHEGIPMFEIVTVAMMVAGPINVLIAALTAGGDTRAVLRAQLLASAVYLAAGLLGVAAIGAVGLAAGLIVSRWTWLAALAVSSRGRLGVRFPPRAAVCLAVALGLYAVLLVSAHRTTAFLLAAAPVAALVWVGTSWELALTTLRAGAHALSPYARLRPGLGSRR